MVGLSWRDKNYMGVVYTTNDDGKCDPLEVKHIFCFPYGCTVFWGCTKEEEERFINMLAPFAVEPVSDMEREESYDDFAYLYGTSPLILHYEITLTSNDPEEKLALSFSLAQSAKLFVFEDRVDGTITSTKHIPIHLAEFGKINVSRKEISKLTGKVFLERNEVNLHSDILDTPEWFWEADLWEPRYVAFCKYLDLPNRINILNKRLDILRELLNVLETQLDNSHRYVHGVLVLFGGGGVCRGHLVLTSSFPPPLPYSTKLELIVIALIIVEVVLQVLEIALNDLLHVDRYQY